MDVNQLKQRLADAINAPAVNAELLRDCLRDCRTALESQEQELSGYVRKLAEQVERIAELERLIERLEEKLENKKGVDSALVSAKAGFNDLKELVEQQEQQIADTVRHRNQANERISHQVDRITQLEAQLREREAAFAAMREIAEDCLKHLQWVPDPDTSKGVHPCQTYKRNIERFNATDAGKAILERLQKAEAVAALYNEAQKALDGRLGIDEKAVVWACEQYVAAEDELPDTFDTESYVFSEAVGTLVQRASECDKTQDRLQAVEKKLEQAVSLLRSSDEDAVSKFLETYENRSME